MRVERLPSNLPRPVSDDGLGGYRDTEALGVFGARREPVRRPPREYFEAFPGLGHMAALAHERTR